MINIHLHESSDRKKIPVINDSPNGSNCKFFIKRSWSILINIIQIEDTNYYNTQFLPIPPFNTKYIP